jgi:putative transposase
VACVFEKFASVEALPGVFYRRHLPHWIPEDKLFFVTWRLDGSWPKRDNGPEWLSDPRIAKMLTEALLFGHPSRYRLHAWVILPNHVHAIIEPVGALSDVMHWLKGRTARKANRILRRSGQPFWQSESFDRWIRDESEFYQFKDYIETNPVRAGLASRPEDWGWSSAGDRFLSPANS